MVFRIINKKQYGVSLVSLKITLLGWEVKIFEIDQILLTGSEYV